VTSITVKHTQTRTQVRVVWYASLAESFNVSLPFHQMKVGGRGGVVSSQWASASRWTYERLLLTAAAAAAAAAAADHCCS
jgi:hypothetical protein